MRLRALAAALLVALAPAAAPAQQDGALAMGQVRSAILTIDVDRLLAETQFGKRLSADLRDRSEALAAENARLADQLQAEERSLTERRAAMEVEAFRAEADAFDQRVQRIRAEQDAKQTALEDGVAQGRQTFLNAATPVLARLMIDSGAVVILERRTVFLSAGLVDITDKAIAAIDTQLGDGGGVAPSAPDGTPTGPEAPAGPDEGLLAPEPAPLGGGGEPGTAGPAPGGG